MGYTPGSTPTCVGTTQSASRRRRQGPVYPHMRGDHVDGQTVAVGSVGLPPHAWGHFGSFGESSACRVYPTCVGTRRASSPIRALLRSTPHAWGPLRGGSRPAMITGLPHMRGDHGTVQPAGSPTPVYPHMRGDHADPRRPVTGKRSTPTCVGTTATALPCQLAEGSTPTAWGPPWPT